MGFRGAGVLGGLEWVLGDHAAPSSMNKCFSRAWGISGLRFRVWGLGFRGLGFRGLGFRGLGLRV